TAWTTSGGTLAQDSSSSDLTQGKASLKVTGVGAGVTLTSIALGSGSVSVAGHLSVDVRVPKELAGRTGASVQLCLQSPQRGISTYVCSGHASLDGVGVSATPTYYTVPWTIPSATVTALKGGSFTDLTIRVSVSGIPTAAQSAAWLFDRMLFF